MVLELLFEYGEHESSSVAQILNVVRSQDPSSRVVTRARIGFRARVTYFELGCPETNIDPIYVYLNILKGQGHVLLLNWF